MEEKNLTDDEKSPHQPNYLKYIYYNKRIETQDALIKRLGPNAHPFTMEVTPMAPPSVQLVPAKEYNGAPIGTSYDIRAFAGKNKNAYLLETKKKKHITNVYTFAKV